MCKIAEQHGIWVSQSAILEPVALKAGGDRQVDPGGCPQRIDEIADMLARVDVHARQRHGPIVPVVSVDVGVRGRQPVGPVAGAEVEVQADWPTCSVAGFRRVDLIGRDDRPRSAGGSRFPKNRTRRDSGGSSRRTST